ncbi:MAG: HAD family hydrolase [Planctomycetota bacterium]|nr:HAD family hydrolase [Planctomycetota bacterium]MDP6762138.1 HAD family hydrolase [Planctomycetota bacterium]MDP6990612.1 HAD family hydrolase [Planctomycetota bacterium]
MSPPPEALLLDLDGTLLDGSGRVRPRNRSAISDLEARGVVVMVVTGRSAQAALPIVEDLGLASPTVLFNGAAVFCPDREALIEERVLSNAAMDRALSFSAERDLLTLVMTRDRRLALEPRGEAEQSALRGLSGIELVGREELAVEYALRVSWLSAVHPDSRELAAEVEAHVARPATYTHFPLAVIAEHRESAMQVCDMHAPCLGKGEAVRFVEERYGIAPERVAAVGDATNDLGMFEAAGLAVCMGSGMAEARSAADLVIGDHDGDAIAEWIDDTF